MTEGPSAVRLLAANEAIAGELRRLDRLRAGGISVTVVVKEGPANDAVHSERAAPSPLGYVATAETESFAALTAGADDACVAAGLNLPGFIAFIDRVALRARQRQDAENRRVAVAHAEKLAAIGTIVAGVAHEINNPLAGVVYLFDWLKSALDPLVAVQQEIFRLAGRGSIVLPDELSRLEKLAMNGTTPDDIRSGFDDLKAQLATIEAIVKGLRIFARADDVERPEPVFLPQLVGQVVRMLGKQVTYHATLEQDYAHDLPLLLLPRSRLTQVFTNLLINAVQAVQEVKRPLHRVRISVRGDAEAVVVSITDSGPGIPPEIIERVFDPFFTTKSLGEQKTGGSGLGLSISRAILQDLGGDLVVESVHGEGATFIAIIPTEGRIVDAKSLSKSKNPPPEVEARSSVLVIDDEEILLRSLAMALKGRFDVMLANDGQEAIELLESGSKPDAILCDVVMPVVDGPKFYEWLTTHHPELVGRTVFITANVDGASEFIERIDKPVLEKPVPRDRLIGTIERVMGPRRPAQSP